MVVMFADLAGYTALTDVHGDAEAVTAVESFHQVVSRVATDASEAHAGQILVTPQVLEAATSRRGTEPLSVGTRTFRNVSTPIELFDICHDRSTDKFIDPIRQMLVSAESAAASLRHEGDTLYFCSVDCLKRFVAINGDEAAQ